MGRPYQGSDARYVDLRKLPRTTEVYVSVYEVTRCCGGSEEGGWWYDWYTYTGESYTRRLTQAFKLQEKVLTELQDEQPVYGRHSAANRGEPELVVVVEARRGVRQDTQRPRYE